MQYPLCIQIEKNNYAVSFTLDAHNCCIQGGRFRDVALHEAPLFFATIENVSSGEEKQISSCSNWEKVDCRVAGDTYTFSFSNPEHCGDMVFIYTAVCDDRGITWHSDVINDSPLWSVTEVTYPMAKAAADDLNLFLPTYSGMHLADVGNRPVFFDRPYPSTHAVMQYFAFWSKQGGIYLGYHDPDASQKILYAMCGKFNPDTVKYIGYFNPSESQERMPVKTERGEGCVYVSIPGINAGVEANSFTLGGTVRWEAFNGDWYDATMLYADFVQTHAKWLPAIDDNGRPDTAQKFKEIPFWITDYIPNSPEQRDARPMVLGAVSQLYDKNYWFEAPIELKKRLGVPVAYHVYNWHEIPFNINYPHYTPARAEFFRGADALKEAGLMLMPYINAVSWEEKDADEGFDVNFSNTGHKGVAVKKDGSHYFTVYPQVKRDGTKTHLTSMCPSYAPWHQIIEKEVRTIEETMPVDGVYFDEIAAHAARPCYSKDHAHLPGGGSYWSDGYNLMMAKINRNKPENSFYFTESNAEPYMKSFDGYLTWLWREPESVPAFPAVYAGYIQMIGRFTDGVNREDDLLFRYHLADALVYGQQLGWVNAAVLYRENRMPFLEKMVHLRYAYTDVFNGGKLCRPPKVRCSLAPVVSSGNTWEQVVCGAWKMRKNGKVTIFVINVAETACACDVVFNFKEYGLAETDLPEAFTIQGDNAVWHLTMEPTSASVKEI